MKHTILEVNADLVEVLTEMTKGLLVMRGAISLVKGVQGTEIVYIAGKVTGLPEAEYRAKFQKRKDELMAAGYLVINPCDFLSSTTDWFTAMAVCYLLLPFANRINLLHDWQDSNGATDEKCLADKLGIKTLEL